MVNNYEKETKERFGSTDAYKEYKTKNYKEEELEKINIGLNNIFIEFSKKLKEQYSYESSEVQELVRKLQKYISDNYYNCTNEILLGLGKMYISDERFKENLDQYETGNAKFISSAIKFYCK